LDLRAVPPVPSGEFGGRPRIGSRILKLMRLQRIAFHRVVRILSGILPVLIVTFVGVAVWQYWARTHDDQPSAMRPLESLPPGIALEAEGVSVDRTPDFHLEASRLTTTTDETSYFEGVRVTVFPRKEGDETRHIRGDRCSYDKKTDEVSCTGKVSVELDPLTTAYTEQIHYDKKAGLISSPVPTRLERPGHMTGTSGQMQSFLETGLLRLTNGVDIDLTEGGGLRAGVAVFQHLENWATLSQGVELKSANGWLRGGSGRADLAPGTYRPTKVTIENGASMESKSASLFTLNSEWLQGDLTTEGKAEHVLARGKVVAKNESTGSDKAVSGKLEAPEIEAWLNAMGRPENIEARQNPVFENVQGALSAENTIRIDYAARSIKTQGKSLLTSMTEGRKTSSIDGRDFVIVEKQGSREFSTQSRAKLESSDMTTTANTTMAVIDGVTNKIVSLDQAGMVILDDKSRNRSGKAGKLKIENNGDRIVLEQDNPEVKEGPRVLKAQKITLLQADKSFTGEGDVTMTDTSSKSRSGFVQASHAQGNEERIEYRGKVELFTEAGKIDADELVYYPKRNRFEADKNVSSTGDRFRARSDRLVFIDEGNDRQTADYTGNVTATKTDEQGVDLVLTTQALKVELKSGKMETLVATSGADITKGTQWKGSGDSVDYNVATGKIVLKGTSAKEAELRRGVESIRGCVITIIPKGGESVLPCSDRSVPFTIKVPK
jgi:LPS export ABC transporter protein LptC